MLLPVTYVATNLEHPFTLPVTLLKVAQSSPAPGTRTVSAVLPTFNSEPADADATAW